MGPTYMQSVEPATACLEDETADGLVKPHVDRAFAWLLLPCYSLLPPETGTRSAIRR